MRANLNQLRIFFLAAQSKSMKRAAEILYVSPPAVTMQIRKLEDWLGFPVFERAPGELRLTERGRDLYEAVAPVFSGLDDLERCIHGMVHEEDRRLRLGTHHLPAKYFIPDLISHVRAAYPKLELRMELGTQEVLLQRLCEQQLDMVLVVGDLPQSPHYKLARLFDEEMALVTDAGCDLGAAGPISARGLGSIPLILQQKGTGVLSTVCDFMDRHAVRPDVLLDNLSSDVITQFLPQVRAAAFIFRFIARRELETGVFREIPIAEGSPVCHFHLAYPNTRHLPLKLRHFLAGVEGFSPAFHRAAPPPAE